MRNLLPDSKFVSNQTHIVPQKRTAKAPSDNSVRTGAFCVFERIVKMIILVILLVYLPFTAFAQTEVSGEVSGEWTVEDSPYIIVDSTWVPEDEELRIGPGVDVLFGEGLGIDAFGIITVHGTAEDSVFFQPTEGDTTWRGFVLWASNDEYSFDYCRFNNADVTFALRVEIILSLDHCNIISRSNAVGSIKYYSLPNSRSEGNTLIMNSCNIIGDLHGLVYLRFSRIIADSCLFDSGTIAILLDGGLLMLSNCETIGHISGLSIMNLFKTKLLPYSESSSITFCGEMRDCEVDIRMDFISMDSILIHDSVINGELRADHSGVGRISGTTFNAPNGRIYIEDLHSFDIDECTINGSLFIEFDSRSNPRFNITNSIFSGRCIQFRCPPTNRRANIREYAEIRNCTFYGGISTGDVYSLNVINNTFINSGFYIDNNRPGFFNNFKNNILITNIDSARLIDFYQGAFEHVDDVVFDYNCIYGYEYLLGSNARANDIVLEFDDTNIFEDPLLVSLDPLDPHLEWNSPCIDAGDPDSPLDPDSTRADIGRFYFHHENAISFRQYAVLDDFEMFSAYPNPFNSKLNIDFFNPLSQPITITLYDINGRELIKEDLQWYNTGRHSVALDGGSLPSGSYFVSLKNDNSSMITKVELIR
ncbi:T9SS type A sorting domain-containing protein [bacterium]|nr:T9SS type A sorting domain-containing protein [bacterium]